MIPTSGVVVKNVAVSSGNLELDSRLGKLGRNAVNGSPPLSRFFGAVLPRHQAAEIDPATRHTTARYCGYNQILGLWGLIGSEFGGMNFTFFARLLRHLVC